MHRHMMPHSARHRERHHQVNRSRSSFTRRRQSQGGREIGCACLALPTAWGMLDVSDYEILWPPDLFTAQARRILARPRTDVGAVGVPRPRRPAEGTVFPRLCGVRMALQLVLRDRRARGLPVAPPHIHGGPGRTRHHRRDRRRGVLPADGHPPHEVERRWRGEPGDVLRERVPAPLRRVRQVMAERAPGVGSHPGTQHGMRRTLRRHCRSAGRRDDGRHARCRMKAAGPVIVGVPASVSARLAGLPRHGSSSSRSLPPWP
jgi:hypothetical protein